MRPPSRVAVKGKRGIMPESGAVCHKSGDFSVIRCHQTPQSRTAPMPLEVRWFTPGLPAPEGKRRIANYHIVTRETSCFYRALSIVIYARLPSRPTISIPN